jgi:hypothetical protein
MATTPRKWLMPPTTASQDERLGFLKDSRQEGENYLRSQRAWGSIDRGLDAIADDRSDPTDPALSRVRYNSVKRGIREIVATLSNLRVVPNYTTQNNRYINQANILNKRYLAWHQNPHIDVRGELKKCLQWAAVCGKSYCQLGFGRQFVITGTPELRLHAKGPRSVLVNQIGEGHDIQQAYQVHIVHEMPYFEALARFPYSADKLTAGAKPSNVLRRGARAVSRFISPMMRIAMGKDREGDPDTFPVCQVIETYTLDPDVNNSQDVMHMGTPGSTWEYYVYPDGGQIPTGIIDPSTGQELTRHAERQDALLFPTRRLTWWNESGILIGSDGVADGPSHWWHGYVPLVEFQLDPWPWEFLGYPLTHDALPLQKSVRDGLRAIDDSQNVRLRPPLAYLKNRVSRNFMRSFDPRVPLQYIGIDGMTLGKLDELIKSIFPPSQYDVPQWLLEYVKANEARIDRLLGVMDAMALAKARQIPAGDTMEKLMELMGPVIQDMSASMDQSIVRIGEMQKFNFMQFDTLSRRLEILGTDGVTKEDFDYSPSTLVPDDGDSSSRLKTAWDRGRAHANNFVYQVTPGSLHQITSMARRLILYQLFKTPGFPMDPWTVADSFDIFLGPKPQNCNTPVELWAEWQRILAQMKAHLAQEFGGEGQQPSGPRGGRSGTGGRAPTGGHAPQLKSRPDGRSTVQESR